ncbi:MAG: hypothetical protein Q8P16_02490 [bacterium]|nr:hypothetical protein [bacterium]
MLNIIKKNKIIFIVLVLVIAGFLWFGLSDREPQTSTGLLTSQTNTEISASEQEILKLLLDMRSIRLDSAVFGNPAFATLQDFGREIVPEPVGRPNPFAPAAGSAGLGTPSASVAF